MPQATIHRNDLSIAKGMVEALRGGIIARALGYVRLLRTARQDWRHGVVTARAGIGAEL